VNQKDFYTLAIQLGATPDGQNFVVKRDQFVEFMRARGYADRTINNHSAPSRDGGIINRLLAEGLIVDGGVKRWIIPCVQKLNALKSRKSKQPVVRMFQGNPPTEHGWISSTRLDDDDVPGTEWRMYRKEFAPGCNNIKVVALGSRVPHKANYWLVEKNGKIVMTKSALLLQQHRPKIFENLCEDIEDLHS